MRLTTIISIMFCWVLLLSGRTVSKVAFTDSRGVIRAFSEVGEISLPISRVQLDIRDEDGKTQRGDLVVVFNPQTGDYLWRHAILSVRNSYLEILQGGGEAIYASSEGLIDFVATSRLWVGQYRDRVNSLDAAEAAAIAAIGRGKPTDDVSGFAKAHKDVILRPIADEFACGEAPAPHMAWPPPNCFFTVKSIVWIAREGENWRVILRNHYDQEVILDSKYDLVSTRRLPKPFDPRDPSSVK